MSKLQVLVATMGRDDLSLVEKMNIRCDAIIANQADREEIVNEVCEFGKIKMITTATKGVGLNRNIALMAADAEIILFADDDVVYNDDMPESVVAAFKDNPDADMIVFSIDIVRNKEVSERRYLKNKRLHVWNSMRFGTVLIAVKREAIVNSNITFHQCFGGGCRYSYGEDSLFIKACFNAGLHIYSHSYVLGSCSKDASTCFTGYHERYFYEKGILMRYLFPHTAWMMAMYFSVSFRRQTSLSVFRRIKYMYSGLVNAKKMVSYSEKYEKDSYSK